MSRLTADLHTFLSGSFGCLSLSGYGSVLIDHTNGLPPPHTFLLKQDEVSLWNLFT